MTTTHTTLAQRRMVKMFEDVACSDLYHETMLAIFATQLIGVSEFHIMCS